MSSTSYPRGAPVVSFPAAPRRPHVFLFSRKLIAKRVRSQIVYDNIIPVKESGRDLWHDFVYTSVPCTHWHWQSVKHTHAAHTKIQHIGHQLHELGFHKVMERNQAGQLTKIITVSPRQSVLMRRRHNESQSYDSSSRRRQKYCRGAQLFMCQKVTTLGTTLRLHKDPDLMREKRSNRTFAWGVLKTERYLLSNILWIIRKKCKNKKLCLNVSAQITLHWEI